MGITFLVFIPAIIFFLRFLMQYSNCDYYHPVCRFFVKLTDPLVNLIKYNPSPRVNVSALIWTFIALELFGFIFFAVFANFPLVQFVIPIFGANIFLFALCLLEFFLYLIFISAILSWIPSRGVAYYNQFIMQLISPILTPLDRLIPPLGVISLSYLVLILIIFALRYAVGYLFGIWLGLFNGFL